MRLPSGYEPWMALVDLSWVAFAACLATLLVEAFR